MHWFGGSMAEAVTLSKQKNSIFVVFVEGDNDLSKELAATIDDGVVIKRLGDPTNFLAVKLKSGSENYTYFAQIYQFVPVPSLFFIGRNGTPLEVVCAGIEPHNLATRIDRILQEHRKDQPNTVQPSTSNSNIKDETVNFLQTEAAATAQTTTKPQNSTPAPIPSDSDVVKNAEEPKPSPLTEEPESSEPAPKIAKTDKKEATKSDQYEVVCDGDVCVRRPKVADQPGPSSSQPVAETPQVVANESSSSAEEKMEKAKELIEIRRREKADKEKELEKQKELERRSVGQGVAELKRWQADQEMKQIQEERKREKMENDLARQRILEQIAQDRAERKAREQPQPVTPEPVVTQPAAVVGDVSGRARVQFKLPDGEAHTTHFEATTTLGDVQQYVADNLHLSASSFSLWTAFPRRELTQTERSLRELQLAPSAALLVLPRRSAAVAARPAPFAELTAFLAQLFTSLILEPTQQIYMWIYSRFFGAPAGPPPTAPSSPPAAPSPPAQGALRRRGNIHRLPGDRSGDDDNNTWNGNSTQQM